jgi:hypothetical protein
MHVRGVSLPSWPLNPATTRRALRRRARFQRRSPEQDQFVGLNSAGDVTLRDRAAF